MIYIFTALYPEAKPLIRAFSLKKAVAWLPFDVYENMDGDLRLVITGAGMTAAACGVSAVFGRYGAGERDHLINIGTCAAENPASEKKMIQRRDIVEYIYVTKLLTVIRDILIIRICCIIIPLQRQRS
ncbi:hypothetical protein DXB96_05665 [Clostridium sp. OM07-10AC]|nr:hypothetical protein DXB96_05665 [Clostridium sp. OM07-10AC]